MSANENQLSQRRVHTGQQDGKNSDDVTTAAKDDGTKQQKLQEDLPPYIRNMDPRWKNWWIRSLFTLILIGAFSAVIYAGPISLTLMVICIQVRCFYEIIAVGHKRYREENLPFFRSLSWFFVATVNYFLYGESLSQYFQNFLQKDEFLQPLVSYHRFISYMMYTCCFVLFVLSLKKGYYMVQFTLFGWTHIIMLLLVAQSHLMIQNIFEGIIWFLLPVALVICNDIMAYIFGFFFGRTPLIKLSPKKTWEGFIGALFSTLIFGFFFTSLLVKYEYFICPVKYNNTLNKVRMECDAKYPFQLREYSIPIELQGLLQLFGHRWKTLTMYPVQVHTFAFSIFGSLIAPFGGFFASGFKRAFQVKDFAAAIPGHGGLMDRFDCQLLTSTFVHVYYFSFLRNEDPTRIIGQIRKLNVNDQLYLFEQLKQLLEAAGKFQ